MGCRPRLLRRSSIVKQAAHLRPRLNTVGSFSRVRFIECCPEGNLHVRHDFSTVFETTKERCRGLSIETR